MLSLSTSWNSQKHTNGFDLIKEVKAAGFDTVELNFALTENMVEDILSLKVKSEIKVSSLHNMCPLPREVAPDEASPDYYSLASPDQEERELAVAVAKNTIDYANKFEAKAVVLHMGRVQIKDRTRDLATLTDDVKKFEVVKAEMIRERHEKRDGYLDNAMKSLSELIPYAKRFKILLGVENRYYYREIPVMEELKIIFNNFKDPALVYWHDVGHAEAFDRLGLVRHGDLLEAFSNRLMGMHLHDIMGIMGDHRVPGLGTCDFSILKPYITKDTIKVLEVHQPATIDQVRNGARHLEKILG